MIDRLEHQLNIAYTRLEAAHEQIQKLNERIVYPYITADSAINVTLRDEFAMSALTGLVVANYGKKDIDPMDVASWAYGIADAMVEARK